MSWGPVRRKGSFAACRICCFSSSPYRKEGKAYFTLGVGCTGGRHRSVAVAEALGDILGKGEEAAVVVHRDLSRSALPAKGMR